MQSRQPGGLCCLAIASLHRSAVSFCLFGLPQVLAGELAESLRAVAGELDRALCEDTLEEQTAALLRMPRVLEDMHGDLAQKLQKIPLPFLGRSSVPRGTLQALPCRIDQRPGPTRGTDHMRCTIVALSGNTVAELIVLKNQPWVDAIPFGCCCYYWGVSSFQLVDGETVVFPRPRLTQRVPAQDSLVLKVLTSDEPPPVHIRVLVGKAAAGSRDYRLQPGTSPLYEFCELQTLMLRDLDRVQLREIDLRSPQGPLAKEVLRRFYEMLQSNTKLGKRTLDEFREEATSTYNLHILVSSDGQRLALRAKMMYDPVYLRLPVVEVSGAASPWNKRAYHEMIDALLHGSV